jgi:hypothetical protein
VALLGLWSLRLDPAHDAVPLQRLRIKLHRRYRLYYFLTFMAGARRPIYIAFSMLLLPKGFHFTVRDMTLLFIINNAINLFLDPLSGRATIKLGERRILSLGYFSVIGIFPTSAFTSSRLLASTMYVADFIVFNFAVAVKTCFQQVSDPADIAPVMAAGFTINQVAAVILPLVGGALWMIDYRRPAGAVLSALNLVAIQRLRVPDDTVPLVFPVAALAV